ncbi:MAG: SIS domain-containing protein [Planctomycetota bacterium]
MHRSTKPNVSQSALRSEILEQPDAVARLLDAEREHAWRLGARIQKLAPPFVWIAARGTSDNAARYAQYAFGMRCGLPVALAAPSLTTLYKQSPRVRGALAIGISQSGTSPDIVANLRAARRGGAFTIAIVNDTNSPLARAADEILPLHAGVEQSVAATKTYTAQLAAVALLAEAILQKRGPSRELLAIPESMERALLTEARVRETAQIFKLAFHAVALSRGINLSTCFELSLKLKELALMLVEPYSSADFEHGPIAMMEPELRRHALPAIVISPPGILGQKELLLLTKRLQQKGAPVISIGTGSIEIPNVTEWLSPLIAAIPCQWLAYYSALAKGFDPDRPRGIAKITRTR